MSVASRVKKSLNKGAVMPSDEYSNVTDENALAEARDLSDKMLKIAEKGFLACKDDSCLLIYGMIMDCGYKIRRTVEQEQHYFGSKDHRHTMIH